MENNKIRFWFLSEFDLYSGMHNLVPRARSSLLGRLRFAFESLIDVTSKHVKSEAAVIQSNSKTKVEIMVILTNNL